MILSFFPVWFWVPCCHPMSFKKPTKSWFSLISLKEGKRPWGEKRCVMTLLDFSYIYFNSKLFIDVQMEMKVTHFFLLKVFSELTGMQIRRFRLLDILRYLYETNLRFICKSLSGNVMRVHPIWVSYYQPMII